MSQLNYHACIVYTPEGVYCEDRTQMNGRVSFPYPVPGQKNHLLDVPNMVKDDRVLAG